MSLNTIPIERITRCNNCGSTKQMEVGRSPDFEYATCCNEFVFVLCGDCGLNYLRDRPTIDVLNTIYPADYIPHKFDEHLGGFISKLRNYVQKIKISPLVGYVPDNGLIMDVGPGNGEFLSLMKQFGRRSWRLCGIDFSSKAIEAVRRLGLEGVVCRFEALEWPGPSPKAITMNQVIEHLDDPAGAIAKAYELLAPGGVLFLETPSTDSWDYKLFRKRYWGGWHTPRHWVLFDEKSLGAMMERAGFTIVETTYLLSPNFWLQSIHHFLLARAPRLAKIFDVKNLPLLAAASSIDVVQKMLRNRTSNFRIVGRKPD